MTVFLAVYAGAGAFVWLSAFGYLIALRIIARRRAPSQLAESALPKIAVVIPTLNEERLIVAKIQNLAKIDYPRERISIVVVDGGSSDATGSLVEKEAERDRSIRFIRLARVSSKIDQIKQALEAANEEFVIFTDADSLLEPSCIQELVHGLLDDPRTALLGAAVKPATDLLEERIHWMFLNYLWWLEGEALTAGMFSAVCYGVRRSALLPLMSRLREEKADDVHLAHLLAGEGLRVRLCRSALATEVRVPRTPKELLEFRGRRGIKYVRALLSVRPGAAARPGVKLARFMRLWHFQATPVLAAVLAAASVGLFIAGYWIYPAVLAGSFIVPALFVLLTSSTIGVHGWERCTLALAGLRLVLLTWLSLLQISRYIWLPASPKETR